MLRVGPSDFFTLQDPPKIAPCELSGITRKAVRHACRAAGHMCNKISKMAEDDFLKLSVFPVYFTWKCGFSVGHSLARFVNASPRLSYTQNQVQN